MRKLVVLAVSCGALAVAIAAPSSAQACRTVKCFNKAIGGLQAQVTSLNNQVQADNAALSCIKRTAVTSYFGYDYNGVANDTTALDFTSPGDLIDAWMLVFTPGTCGAGTVRSAGANASTSAASPFGPLALEPSGTRRSP
jgi:hypothetical protein